MARLPKLTVPQLEAKRDAIRAKVAPLRDRADATSNAERATEMNRIADEIERQALLIEREIESRK